MSNEQPSEHTHTKGFNWQPESRVALFPQRKKATEAACTALAAWRFLLHTARCEYGKKETSALPCYTPVTGLPICLRLHLRAGSLHQAQPAAAQAGQEERRATKKDRRSCSRTATAAWSPRTAAEGKALLNKELSLHVHSTDQLNEPKYGTFITEKRISSAPFQEPHRPRLLMSATLAAGQLTVTALCARGSWAVLGAINTDPFCKGCKRRLIYRQQTSAPPHLTIALLIPNWTCSSQRSETISGATKRQSSAKPTECYQRHRGLQEAFSPSPQVTSHLHTSTPSPPLFGNRR